MPERAAVITLGCAKNSVDSEHIKGSLVNSGLSLTEDPENADYIIINTCGFIEAAKQESINTILELIELNNGSKKRKIIVTGCLAQRYYSELSKEIPEIDLIVDISREYEIADILKNGSITGNGTVTGNSPASPVRDFSTYPQRILSELPYAYLQIADGCNNRCSYCAIPFIRGTYKSKPIEQVIEEARWLDDSGIKEINLIAQDTGNYGYDLYERKSLTDLLKALTGFTNVEWIRLLYLQPYNINDELIEAINGNSLILPYIDIPFQHASPRILRAMNRHGAGSDYLGQIAWLRRMVPGVVLRTSIIVGFPGETNAEFEELIDFVKKAEFDYLGVFEYSPEEGTKAAELKGMVPEETVKERYHELTALQDSLSQRRSEERVGKVHDALIESIVDSEEGLFEARAWWQAPEVDGFTYVAGSSQPGQIIKAYIDEFDGCDFHGRILSGPGK
ncbi:MAG: 30S ribosomal protein S12 methylthiotransferase RimO [Candidatus Aquicultor sp.]